MTCTRTTLLLVLLGCICVLFPVSVNGRSVLGVDLGAMYMKVALVRSGSPLEIVTNLHSKRKTEQMVLFDQKQRFFGADANGLLQRKAHLTPTSMAELLGRAESHPSVQVRQKRMTAGHGRREETCSAKRRVDWMSLTWHFCDSLVDAFSHHLSTFLVLVSCPCVF